jgi:bifunctional non-homologous end joining protein LigD
VIPPDENEVRLEIGGRELKLTNLSKTFWEQGISKRALLQYYSDISEVLLPHLKNRAMVMKRYPNGAEGKFFFQKRVPDPHPEWIETCEILHASGSRIRFPMIQDVPSLLWVVNLGCIDLNQWYATCDDVDRPDYLHFDLDPGPGATFDQVLETALAVRSTLSELKIPVIQKLAVRAAFTSTCPFAGGQRKSRSGASPRSFRGIWLRDFRN